jgi:hypothetical protein
MVRPVVPGQNGRESTFLTLKCAFKGGGWGNIQIGVYFSKIQA